MALLTKTELDLLYEALFSDYTDLGPGRKLIKDAATGVLPVRHYSDILPTIETSGTTELATFWRSLIEGRDSRRQEPTDVTTQRTKSGFPG